VDALSWKCFSTEKSWAFYPLRAALYQRIGEFRGWKKRTSAAKAGYGSVIYGTAEAVPFQDRVFTQTLLAPEGIFCSAHKRT
jgi:hypothetical protein